MTPLKRIPLITLAAATAVVLSPPLLAQSSMSGSGARDPQSGMSGTRSSTPSSQSDRSTLPNTGTTASSSQLSGADKAFAMKAASDGLAEVELGRLAQEKGTTDEVKSFGKRMVDDHTKANDELKSIASTKGITLPTDTDSSHKRKMEKMQALSGAAFDAAYSKDMVKEHKKDVKLFRKEADKGKDPELKAFAQKTLTTLQSHHQTAESMEGTMNHGSMTNRTRDTGKLPNAGDTGTGSTKSPMSGSGGGGSTTNPTSPQ